MIRITKWICIQCEQTFTRRGNAFRHGNNKHDTTFDSVIQFREYLKNKTTSQSFLIPNNASDFNQLSYQQNWNFQAKRINPHTDTISNTIDNYTSPEKLLYNTMIELAPKYEEIENLLSHMPEPKKASDSWKYCESSYGSYNLVIFMNTQLKIWRNATVCNRMIKNVSVFSGLMNNLQRNT